MPMLTVSTNQKNISSDLSKTLSKEVAKTTGKPEQYVAVRILSDVNMAFGGSQEPCAVARLESIGNIGGSANKNHSKNLTEALAKGLGVDKSRIYIVFANVEGQNWGFNGSTFG